MSTQTYVVRILKALGKLLKSLIVTFFIVLTIYASTHLKKKETLTTCKIFDTILLQKGEISMLTNRDILKIIDTAEEYKNRITKVTNALEYSNLAPNDNYTHLLMSTLTFLQEEYKEWLGLEISTQEGEGLEYEEEVNEK